jgi:hypothetical protein
MCLDPGSGPDSLWQRLPGLEVPVTFLWAGRDGLIPRRHAELIGAVLPRAPQVEVPCSGHFVNGAHFRCMRHAIVLAVEHTLAPDPGVPGDRARTLAPCLADAEEIDPELPAAGEDPITARAAGIRGELR